jgi:hypothetical protein
MTTKPDIIFLNEHWLNKNEVKLFHIHGYCLAASYGRGKKLQGGSLILVKEYLHPHVKEIKIKSTELKFEICGAKLQINNTKLTLISLYRPNNPVSNRDIPGFFENLENFLEKHRGVNDIILAGDLNLDLLKDDTNSRLLKDIFKTYDMTLLNINQVTRPNDNLNGGTLIDHIFTSIPNSSNFDILKYNYSDHDAILATLDLPIERPKDVFRFVRKFNDENWSKFQDLLIKESWDDLYQMTDIDDSIQFNFYFCLFYMHIYTRCTSCRHVNNNLI